MSNLYTRIGEIFRPVTGAVPTSEKKYYGDEEYADYPSKAWDKVKMPSAVDKIEDAEVIEERAAFHIESGIYEKLAAELNEKIDGRKYVDKAEITIEDSDLTHIFEASSIYVSHAIISQPDGNTSEIERFNPVWFEFHTFEGAEMDERHNDFSIYELRKYL